MAPKNSFSFEERIQHLIDYEAENGHLFVPTKCSDFGNLGRYVNNTRTTKSKLSSEQKAKLDEIGFVWVVPKGSAKEELIQWGNKFKMLIQFHKSKNHCNVPAMVGGKPYPLASWCDEQRQRYGEGNLDQNKMDKLTRLGFDFFGSSTTNTEEEQPATNKKRKSMDDDDNDEVKNLREENKTLREKVKQLTKRIKELEDN